MINTYNRADSVGASFPLCPLIAVVNSAFTLKTPSDESMSSIKRDVKKKSSASTGGEILFSASSPLL
jgi:hypothetical protein